MQDFYSFLLDEPPKITVHPKSLKEIWPGKPVVFTVQATGTDPLSYHWQWKPAAEEGEWQPCRAEWSDGATLAIPSVQKSSEGSYRCVISNYAGTQTSNPAELIIGKNMLSKLLYIHVMTWHQPFAFYFYYIFM